MNNPKVLVGCPTSDYHEYCLNEYAKAVKNLSYDNYDILLVDNSEEDNYVEKLKDNGLNTIKGPYLENVRQRIITSRNLLSKYVLDHNYDYLLSLEQDVIPPMDVIEKLLNAKKRVISGIYFTYVKNKDETRILPVVWSRIKGEYRYLMRQEELHKGIKKVAITGLGCILIHKSVLKDIEFRYKEEYPAFDDVYFGLDCKEKGIKIYADTNLICKHLIKNRPWNWDDLINQK